MIEQIGNEVQIKVLDFKGNVKISKLPELIKCMKDSKRFEYNHFVYFHYTDKEKLFKDCFTFNMITYNFNERFKKKIIKELESIIYG